jgi:glyoxylase-like metal-dependent hydrolase (beta-lactamase superfamily II)
MLAATIARHKMKIVVFKYGESVFGENYIFKGGRKGKLLPISFVFYLIQTNERNILVDVGCDDKAGFSMSVFKKPIDILKEYGIVKEQITDVIVTHAHHDHIAAIDYYKNAKVYIQEEEYPQAKKYVSEDFKVHLFSNEYYVDKNVLIRKIGGHSIGSSIVLANQYLFCGDECYVEECMKNHIPTGASYCADKSRDFVNEYGNGKYIPLLFHDSNIMKGKVGWEVICDED